MRISLEKLTAQAETTGFKPSIKLSKNASSDNRFLNGRQSIFENIRGYYDGAETIA